MAIEDYDRIARAIRFIESNLLDHPDLDEIAAASELSPFHFQRLFSRWAGVSPKRLSQYLTFRYAQRRLEGMDSVMNATYDSGLSSLSRLHELFVRIAGVTPAQYRDRGRGMTISYGYSDSPFGHCFIASTDRGITRIAFTDDLGDPQPLGLLRQDWPDAEVYEDSRVAADFAGQIFRGPGEPPEGPAAMEHRSPGVLAAFVKGTAFQLKVWEALLTIPPGRTLTYGRIAAAVGSPGASRAVGNAVGDNPVAFLIPCHRVIRSTGALGGYRWGTERKASMLTWEAVRAGSVFGFSGRDTGR